jgi:hypothetical protein
MRSKRSFWLQALLMVIVLATFARPVDAQPVTGAISGTVSAGDGRPMSGVHLVLRGPVTQTTSSDSAGHFQFINLPQGIFSLEASQPGYTSVTQEDIAVVSGANVSLTVSLSASSFSSLREIGRVTVSGSSIQLNTSPAAVDVISSQTFIDQGQMQVMNVLNETPGVITTTCGFCQANSNNAVMGVQSAVQIRGALPYETETLLDGHPVNVGSSGYYTPNFINPYFLQDVEVIKGPGALAPEINYAIGGSVNYRTIDPTKLPQFGFDIGSDRYGGVTSNYRATGTTLGGKLGYAFDYVTGGSPGPVQGQKWAGSTDILSGATINGQTICGNAPAGANCPYAFGAGNPNVQSSYMGSFPLEFCCTGVPSTFSERAELAKLRFNFSTSTSLTASYLGAQALWNAASTEIDPTSVFDPPAGYVPSGNQPVAGSLIPYNDYTYYPVWQTSNQGLFQSELRTTIGNATLLGRFYSGASNGLNYNYPFGTTFTFNALANGGIYLGSNTTPTIFNNTPVTVSQTDTAFYNLTSDHFRGESVELNLPGGENLYTVSYDRNTYDSYAFGAGQANSFFDNPPSVTIAPGSSELFQTILARGIFQLSPTLQGVLSNYFIDYTVHYSPDGGASFADSTHTFFGPRIAFTWRPNFNTSWRASAGSSIAPPYISLLSIPSGPPVGNNFGAATLYTQQISSGQVAPETAFGWDLGVDQRLPSLGGTVISSDLYQTVLRNQFLSATTADGTYTATSGANAGITAPLYLTQTANLGHSQYAGIEFSARRAVPKGVGFTANFSLIRAYPYDLPAGFYNTAGGPNTTNLGILPYVNFQTSGNGYNGMSYGRVPYAQGYGEVNYTFSNSAHLAVGMTYYGNNNPYNEPAFEVVSASFRYPIGQRSSLVLSAYNLTGAYSALTPNIFAGIPVPLVNGLQGATQAGNIGPTNVRLDYHLKIGQ